MRIVFLVELEHDSGPKQQTFSVWKGSDESDIEAFEEILNDARRETIDKVHNAIQVNPNEFSLRVASFQILSS